MVEPWFGTHFRFFCSRRYCEYSKITLSAPVITKSRNYHSEIFCLLNSNILVWMWFPLEQPLSFSKQKFPLDLKYVFENSNIYEFNMMSWHLLKSDPSKKYIKINICKGQIRAKHSNKHICVYFEGFFEKKPARI